MTTSHYISMADGVHLALDVHLPSGPRENLPTILHQTRYMRSVAWRWPVAGSSFATMLDSAGTTRKRFLDAGYAWVDVDVRGSGASFGERPCPWYADEVADGATVIDWIVGQSWSSGKVGTTGVSYSGTCSEMLLSCRHPALVAAIPRFSLYDVYADIAFPGGVHLEWFTGAWSKFNQDLDKNAHHDALARVIGHNAAALSELFRDRGRHLASAIANRVSSERAIATLRRLCRPLSSGVSPVTGAKAQLSQAVADHRENFDVHAGARQMTFRGDRVSETHPESTIDTFSPHYHAQTIADAPTKVLSVSGWYDGGYGNSAAKRFSAHGGWLLLGPWDHGGRQQISPHSPLRKAEFDHDGEMVAFFDSIMRDDGEPDIAPVRYYTMGQEQWKSATTWPIPDVETVVLHCSIDGGLSSQRPETLSAKYNVDTTIGTGRRSRWRTLLGMAVPPGYGDRAPLAARSLTFTTAPLDRELVVTGHALADLIVSSNRTDGAVFAYLEDVAPNGRVTYVTEGLLRILHRAENPAGPADPSGTRRTFERDDSALLAQGERARLRFGLLPVSYAFAPRHSIRLRLTGADADHFAPVFDDGSTFTVHEGSRIELPVER